MQPKAEGNQYRYRTQKGGIAGEMKEEYRKECVTRGGGRRTQMLLMYHLAHFHKFPLNSFGFLREQKIWQLQYRYSQSNFCKLKHRR